MHILEIGGSFVAKVFRGKDFVYLAKFLKRIFKSVIISKPKWCRNSSIEGFIVCQGFHREDPEIQVSDTLNALDLIHGLNFVKQNEKEYYERNQLSEIDLTDIPEEVKSELESDEEQIEFVSCGTSESFDPDMNYSLKFDINTGKIDENKSIEDYKFLKPFPKIVD